MSAKSVSDTTISEFKKRFPNQEAWTEWLLRQPRATKTAADFFAETARKQHRSDTKPAASPQSPDA